MLEQVGRASVGALSHGGDAQIGAMGNDSGELLRETKHTGQNQKTVDSRSCSASLTSFPIGHIKDIM